MQALNLTQLNTADAPGLADLLDGIYEHSPWVAEAAHALRPPQGWPTLAALKHALAQAVRRAGRERQLALLRAHPELAGKAMVAGTLTEHSRDEQGRAGLAHCTPQEFEALQQLNAAYGARFGFPFIVAVRGPRATGLSRQQIIATLQRRLGNPADFEFAEALRPVHRIAELRLNERCGWQPLRGRQVWDWAGTLAVHSDPGYAEQGQLTVAYLGAAHQAVAAQLQAWMQRCGFDEVRVDAVGNVVGVYHGEDPQAPRLLSGSHFDTVRNGGRYDGRLGILVPMAVVAGLHAQRRRLRHGLEVVGFAEEEGLRYQAGFLASSALTGHFQPAWLEQTDAAGITLRDAMREAGLPGEMQAIAALQRDPARYQGFVEVHIEQGPVLDALDEPLGIVTSINGSVRYTGEFVGQACHAGTTPMGQRRDAALAAAELALFVELRASATAASAGTVGTVGVLEVPGASVNVVPGRCRFSLDLRAPTDAARDALQADVLAELQAIARRRGLAHTLHETQRASAAPSAPALQARWEAAVQALGLPLVHLPSGAGHDAMQLHRVMPQAMLFVRGGNAGISHNPLESITDDDAELCVAAFEGLLHGFVPGPAPILEVPRP